MDRGARTRSRRTRFRNKVKYDRTAARKAREEEEEERNIESRMTFEKRYKSLIRVSSSIEYMI